MLLFLSCVYGEKNLAKKTVSAIVQILLTISIPSGRLASSLTIMVAGKIAQDIVAGLLPTTVWYSIAFYEKHSIGLSALAIAGTKWMTTYYSNFQMIKRINSVTEEAVLNGY